MHRIQNSFSNIRQPQNLGIFPFSGKYLDGDGHQFLFRIHVEQTESRGHVQRFAFVLSHW